jgi:hypothetical protein
MSDVSPDQNDQNRLSPEPEPEHQGSIWKHPYFVYILLTVVLFGGLLAAAWLAQMNDWIPRR